MKLRTFVVSLSFLLSFSLLSQTAWAVKKAKCDTPANAILSVWTWQFEAKKKNLKEASACLAPNGRNTAQRHQSAENIPKVFSNASSIDLAWIKRNFETKKFETPDYEDEATGKNRVTVFADHEALVDVYVERQNDGKWLWTKGSLDRVDKYYNDHLKGLAEFVESLPDWLKAELGDVMVWQYLALILLFALGLVVRKILRAVVAARVKKLAKRFGQVWATKIVDVIASPGATLVVAIILRIGYPLLLLPPGAAAILQIAVRVLITLSLVWALYRAVDVLAAKMEERAEQTESKLDDQLIPLVRKALKALVFVAGILFVLQNLNVNVKSLLAGLGIGGLAFALAAKDTLANLFGSIMIFVDSPFQIGDWINVSGAEGTVEEVGFRSTRIRTFYDSLIVVPNSKLADSTVDNFQQRSYRRCFITLGLTYDTTPEQMHAFVEGLRAIIQANPTTRKDKYEIHMSGFGDFSLNVMFYIFFKVDTWSEELQQRHKVFLEVMRLAKDLGVGFAFPTQTMLHELVAQPGAERVVPPAFDEAKLKEIVDGYGPKGKLARPEGPTISKGYLPTAPKGRQHDMDADGDGG